jgi:uncharacterized SAM-binding protein YcdF (DUF218 family)/glycosyltransferase involved in cell wall biosynthesis
MTAERAVLRGHDLVCISSIDWDFNWQGHQEIMAAFADNGNRVLFVENTGVRSPRLSDLPRISKRLLAWWKSTKGLRQVRPNLFVLSPLVLPFPHSRVAGWINCRLLLRGVGRWMKAVNARRPIMWTFLPTQLAVDVIDRIAPHMTVYYCIADFEQLADERHQIARSERKLLARADLVFAQGEELAARCAPHPHIHIFPFGVSLKTFDAGTAVAPELRGLSRPIVGYVGGLHRHVDFPLVERLAREVKGTVVLVGPAQTDVSALARLENVVLVGDQPHQRVPEFIRGFDVGIIPYLLNAYTRTVYPTKLNEYLVVGLPVVTTDLPEIRRFNAENGGIVSVARNADEFVAAAQAAVDSAPEGAPARIAAARRNSWETRVAAMSALMAERLKEPSVATDAGWEERLITVARAQTRRVVFALVLACLAYVVPFRTPLLWVVAEPLLVSATPRVADAIVVFAGGVGESGTPQGYQERVQQAVHLYKAQRSQHIVFSSGYIYTFREAEVMKALATSLGVPAEAILLEETGGGTARIVGLVRPILSRHGWTTVLLVSSPYHMRRALLTFHKMAPEITVIPTPGESNFYDHRSGATPAQVTAILYEYVAIAYYWWKGWI